MEARRRIMRFLVRSQEAFMPIAMGMQALTLTLVAFDFISWRGIHPYIAVPTIFLILVTMILGWGYIFVEKWGLFRAKRAGMATMDPVQIYAYTPFQEMQGRHQGLPILKGLVAIGEKVDADVEEIKVIADRLEKWLDLGYIPKKDFPDHLKHYYTIEEGHRL